MKKLVEQSVEYMVIYSIPDSLWDQIIYGFENAKMFQERLNFRSYFHNLSPKIKNKIVVSEHIKHNGELNGIKMDSIILEDR